MLEKLDNLDIKILVKIDEDPGKPLIEYLRPFLKLRKLRTLYDRVGMLAIQDLISLDHESNRKFCLARITPDGKAAIMGRESPAPAQGARSS